MTLLDAGTAARDACVATTMRGPAAAVDATIDPADAAFLMGTLQVPYLLVGSNGNGWGVLSELELLRAVSGTREERSAGALRTAEAVLVDIGEDLRAVAGKLLARGSAHGIVTDAGAPVGVISALDIVSALGR